MIDEIKKVKNALKSVDNSLMLLNREIALIPIEEENKTLQGYFNEIMEQKAEFKMALEKIENKYKPISVELTYEEYLTNLIKKEKINIFIAAGFAQNKQKFWSTVRKTAEEMY